MGFNETWQECCTTGLGVHLGEIIDVHRILELRLLKCLPYNCVASNEISPKRGHMFYKHALSSLKKTFSSDKKATATNRMHSNDVEARRKKCCYLRSIPKSSFFTCFCAISDLVISTYFLLKIFNF